MRTFQFFDVVARLTLLLIKSLAESAAILIVAFVVYNTESIPSGIQGSAGSVYQNPIVLLFTIWLGNVLAATTRRVVRNKGSRD